MDRRDTICLYGKFSRTEKDHADIEMGLTAEVWYVPSQDDIAELSPQSPNLIMSHPRLVCVRALASTRFEWSVCVCWYNVVTVTYIEALSFVLRGM